MTKYKKIAFKRLKLNLIITLVVSQFIISTPIFAEVSQETMIDIFKRIDYLETKNRELFGKNELLIHEIDKLKKIQKEGFLNVDERVEALSEKIKSSEKLIAKLKEAPRLNTTDNKKKVNDGDADKKTEQAKEVTTTNKPKDSSATANKEAVKSAVTKKEVADKPAKLDNKSKIKAPSKYEKETYQAAFATMKKSPTAGTKAFEEYIKMQPKSPLAANAQYWIGEIKYSHNNYKGAVQDFVKVLQKYKYSDKAPDAAIKLGYSFYALKNWVFARRTFEDILKYFPENANAVNLANKHLAKLKSAGH